MATLSVPTNLVEAARSDRSGALRDWVGRLPETVRGAAERWSLRLGEPYQPGGQCSWVAPARNGRGEDLVLKVAWRHDEALHEADGLRAWAGRGTVWLHDDHASDATSVLLLERCRPGTTLAHDAPEPDRDVVIAALLTRLWTAPTAGQPFRPLQVMCDAWTASFEERLAAAPGVLDPGLARAGIDLFRTLPASAERQVLLCTDLHAANVLAAEREPWLVIDPKPYVGDPAYDPLQHMLNCDERLGSDPIGLTERMADLLTLDKDRLRAWLFARCVIESIDDPAMRAAAAALAPA